MAVHCLVFLVGLRREGERILALRDLAAAPEIFARAETLWLTSELDDLKDLVDKALPCLMDWAEPYL